MATNFSKELLVTPGKKVKLSKWDSEDTLGWEKDHKMKASLDKAIERLDKLQYLLYAEHKRTLLIVLQGLRRVRQGRHHPPRDVRRESAGLHRRRRSKSPRRRKCRTIISGASTRPFRNTATSESSTARFTKMFSSCAFTTWCPRTSGRSATIRSTISRELLHDNNVKIVKFFLHISKDEQKKRFQERIDDPDRRWKISEADFDERKFWDDYTEAYEAVLTKCSTDHAPWYIIPANKKWFRNLAVSHIIAETLEGHEHEIPAAHGGREKTEMEIDERFIRAASVGAR